MSKNIVIFSDGTGQEGGEGPSTNVYKLFNMVLDRSPKQIAFYDRGLGTGWRKITGTAAGMGISKNVCECYEFILEKFQAGDPGDPDDKGDQIYPFGFSRGATTVHILSDLIHLFGILPKSRPELIGQAYKIYKTSDRENRKRRATAFVERHHTMWRKVKFLGVWDTVAALGVPIRAVDVVIDKIPGLKHRFHDLNLSPSVENAYHALAIDDERQTFHPALWDPRIAEDQNMKQVWFCGMHTDVGGGYEEQQLSDIALDWMVRKAKQHGLEIYPRHDMKIDGDPDGTMHDSRGGALSRFFRKKVRSWPVETHGKPVIHESVKKRVLNRDNETHPPYQTWILSGAYDIETED